MVLNITDLAKDKINEVLKENPGKHLRIVIQGMGWGGPRLGLALDEPNDKETIQVNGIDVLVSDSVKRYVDRNTIDYNDSAWGRGFKISRAGYSGC